MKISGRIRSAWERKGEMNKKIIDTEKGRHVILEKLLKETIKDMKKKGFEIPYKNIMMGVEGGKLQIKVVKGQIKESIEAARERTLYGKKGQTFSQINISIPVWEKVLSNKIKREKYWEGLKTITAHELIHAKEGIEGRHDAFKKIDIFLVFPDKG